MVVRGHVENGVVIIDEPVRLREGEAVEICIPTGLTRSGAAEICRDLAGKTEEFPGGGKPVEPASDASPSDGSTVTDDPNAPTWAEVFKDIIGKAEGLPEDASVNHDHYLYGTPKR